MVLDDDDTNVYNEEAWVLMRMNITLVILALMKSTFTLLAMKTFRLIPSDYA